MHRFLGTDACLCSKEISGWVGVGSDNQTVYTPKDEHSTTPPKQGLVLLKRIPRNTVRERSPKRATQSQMSVTWLMVCFHDIRSPPDGVVMTQC